MTTEEMKELYVSGDWIAVYYKNNTWQENDQDHVKYFRWHETTKLIHIKDKEVLDHVLAGGYVAFKWWDKNELVKDFFATYDYRYDYEIIKPRHEEPELTYEEAKKPIHGIGDSCKQDLNGKYCLATKENYEQLVKDGYTPYSKITSHRISETFLIECDEFMNGSKSNATPMHYNKEKECWVFGSLEGEEYAGVPKELIDAQREGTHNGIEQICDNPDVNYRPFYRHTSRGIGAITATKAVWIEQPKQVENITMEDVEHLQWLHNRIEHRYKESYNVDFLIRFRKIIDKLEANQVKDK